MPRKASRVSRRQAHLVFFRVLPALLAAAGLVAASLAGWAFIAGSALFAGSTLTGCPSGDSGVTYTPITGILIDSPQLVAGLGCGTGTGQVYKYAATLTYVDEAGVQASPTYASVFDCYSNGIFANLPEDDSGSVSFDLSIYAFNQASYPVALDAVAYSQGVDYAQAVTTVLANTATANWTTTCTATQSSNVSVLALCQPLAPVGVAGDSGLDAPAEAADAGATDASDAGDASDASDAADADNADAGDAADAADAADATDAADAGDATDTGAEG